MNCFNFNVKGREGARVYGASSTVSSTVSSAHARCKDSFIVRGVAVAIGMWAASAWESQPSFKRSTSLPIVLHKR